MATPQRNQLIASLTPPAYRRIAPKLAPVSLAAKQVLYAPEQAIDHIYFPDTCVISQLSVMRDGATIETGTVGYEGASWVSASIGAPSMPCQTIVVIGGDAHALAIDDLAEELADNEPFRDTLTQYSHALLIHCMRLTGCTGLHTVQQRCARWILGVLDQVPEDCFCMTHELLADLLGIARPSASMVVKKLASLGALKVSRARVTLGDRKKLLAAACDCYGVIRGHYQQVGR